MNQFGGNNLDSNTDIDGVVPMVCSDSDSNLASTLRGSRPTSSENESRVTFSNNVIGKGKMIGIGSRKKLGSSLSTQDIFSISNKDEEMNVCRAYRLLCGTGGLFLFLLVLIFVGLWLS